MKKFLTILTVVLLSGGSSVYGSQMEEFLSRGQSFWQRGLVEFLDDAAKSVREVDVEPAVAARLETFTEIAGSYRIPVEELKKAYQTAVMRAAGECIEKLKEDVAEKDYSADGDIAFLMEDVAGYIQFKYGDRIRACAGSVAQRELEKAMRECISLRYSPMIDAFLRSGECRELLKEFPGDVDRVVYRELHSREKELTENPSLTKEPTLRYILENLRKFGLAGG